MRPPAVCTNWPVTVSVPVLLPSPGRTMPALVSVPLPRLSAPLPWMTPVFCRLPVVSVLPARRSSVPALVVKPLALRLPSATRSVPVLPTGMASEALSLPVLSSRPALSMRPLPRWLKTALLFSSSVPPDSTEMRALS